MDYVRKKAAGDIRPEGTDREQVTTRRTQLECTDREQITTRRTQFDVGYHQASSGSGCRPNCGIPLTVFVIGEEID